MGGKSTDPNFFADNRAINVSFGLKCLRQGLYADTDVRTGADVGGRGYIQVGDEEG